MAFTTQKGLDALLSSLEGVSFRQRVKRKRVFGSSNADVIVGDALTNVADGKRGNDVMLGRAGDDRLAGGNGEDVMFGGDGIDILAGGNNNDSLFGEIGNDQMDGGNGDDTMDGGVGTDILLGGNGADTLVGGDGVDTMTGGAGRDRFVYTGNVFAGGTPALVAAPNIRVLNQPDLIQDYTIGEDQIGLDGQALGLNSLTFQKGAAAQLADGNVIVLTDSFAAAGAAARAIANNNTVKAQEGVFVYFNTTLGLTRVVYSKDLANGGDISVLANLTNQKVAANTATFSANDFSLV
jgi:serralysin